ncbi:chondroitinase-B domain-containing protein [Terrimonas ferruginea]|uniref:chondroitinase-B domain-containing protein n=1 Tax=Terrimonas ferruginea TaxID=249 RepID=UPI0003F80D84|nr:chondroitinase-B domain-containing protein [Terrimonas ferruginea]
MTHLFSLIIAAALLGCAKSNTPSGSNEPVTPAPVEQTASAPLRTVHVSTASQLKAALLDARPGDDIILANGTYSGKFVVAAGKDGTAVNPITLRGSRQAVLDAGSIQTGYVLHLQSSYWIVKGITLTNGLKGLMADGIRNCEIDSLAVNNIGEEGIHLRKFSALNTVRRCTVSHVGLKTPDYGEGIYIGSAKSNWASYTNGQPDKCDSNQVLNNHIGPNVTAECIDVKEGTTAGIIRNNYFDATGITGANSGDSWIDVKGNNYLIESNTGFNPGGTIFKDGYQVHVVLSGWGNNNIFKSNQCTVNTAGYGFNIQLSGSNGTTTGNKVYTSNTVSGAGSGVANIPLTN